MTTRTYVVGIAAGVVATIAAAVLSRPDVVPSPVGPAAPLVSPAPAVKHQLYVFTEDGCPYCDRLEAEMAKPEVRAALDNFAVSTLKNQWMKATSWRVRAYPTMIVTDAAGKELGRHEGYLSAQALCSWLGGFK